MDDLYRQLSLCWAERKHTRKQQATKINNIEVRLRVLAHLDSGNRADWRKQEKLRIVRAAANHIRDSANIAWSKQIRAILSSTSKTEYITGDCCIVHHYAHGVRLNVYVFGVLPDKAKDDMQAARIAFASASQEHPRLLAEAKALEAVVKAKRDAHAAAERDLARELILFQRIEAELADALEDEVDYGTKYEIRNRLNACRSRVKTRQRRVEKLDRVLQNV